MTISNTIQWSFTLMGYHSSQKHKFSTKQVRRGLEVLLIIILHFVYLFRVANTIQEYIYSIFMINAIICIFISFISTANKTVDIFLLIDNIEKIVDEGKSK